MGDVMMLVILALFAVTFATGTYMVMADLFALPRRKVSLLVLDVLKKERNKKRNLEAYVLKLSAKLSRVVHLDEYKRRKIASTLKSAGIKLTPETYIVRAWVKAGLILTGIIPTLIIFPLISFLILFLSVMVYFKETRLADEVLKKKREGIENELPRFVLTLEQELRGSRDVLRILETYKKHAGEFLKSELDITTADMKSGSYEAALSRFEARIGSSMLSDVIRGLLSVLRGDDGRVYFQMLAHDFKLQEIQKLKLAVMKRPSKLRKYSFFMLGCFILIYLVVMAVEIMSSFSTLF